MAAATAASALTVKAVADGGGSAGEDRSEERGILLADGADRPLAQTVQDWVTYADHAVVVTALGEKAVEPATEDPDNPDGQAAPVLRKVTPPPTARTAAPTSPPPRTMPPATITIDRAGPITDLWAIQFVSMRYVLDVALYGL